MTICLWHGTLTARRYELACPRCGNMAGADCDELGRTLVICPCSSAAFLMPLMVGGEGLAWPIDLANLPPEPEDPRPRKYATRNTSARRCGWLDANGVACPRAIGTRSKYCGWCSRLAHARRLPCPEPECPNTMGYRAKRCTSCAYDKHRRDIDAAARAQRSRRKQERAQ